VSQDGADFGVVEHEPLARGGRPNEGVIMARVERATVHQDGVEVVQTGRLEGGGLRVEEQVVEVEGFCELALAVHLEALVVCGQTEPVQINLQNWRHGLYGQEFLSTLFAEVLSVVFV